MQIIDIAVKDIREYENNPRHNEKAIEAVRDSIASFGFRVPIVLDENHVIIAGHTRLRAAEALGMDKVPCIIANDLTPEKVRAYRLADNKTAELAEWDMEKLERELAELTAFDVDMSAFGFDEQIFDIPASDDINIEETITETESAEPVTKSGDIWKLGDHRLICGDSTDAGTIAALMDGDTADLLITDPPYNVAYESEDGKTIQNDDMSTAQFYEFLKAAFENAEAVLREGGAFYIWHADSEGSSFRRACDYAGLTIKQCLIWYKNAFVLGRQDYQWRHEPCLYGWKQGAAHYFIDDRTQSTVIKEKALEIDKLKKDELRDLLKQILGETETTVIKEDKPQRSAEHPTMKPVKLFARLIVNSSERGDIVLDPFGGSGTTLIACEKQNRVCRMAELDPIYCDVIVKRWENLTGEKAVKLAA